MENYNLHELDAFVIKELDFDLGLRCVDEDGSFPNILVLKGSSCSGEGMFIFYKDVNCNNTLYFNCKMVFKTETVSAGVQEINSVVKTWRVSLQDFMKLLGYFCSQFYMSAECFHLSENDGLILEGKIDNRDR